MTGLYLTVLFVETKLAIFICTIAAVIHIINTSKVYIEYRKAKAGQENKLKPIMKPIIDKFYSDDTIDFVTIAAIETLAMLTVIGASGAYMGKTKHMICLIYVSMIAICRLVTTHSLGFIHDSNRRK